MKNLVDAHLERIPADVFVKFQEAIKALASKRHGVYALYKADKLYYVGLAKNLKSRVQQHLKDQHKGKWNMFSLYLVRHVEHLRELETLVIHVAQPKGNTKPGRFAKSENLKPKLKRSALETVKSMFGGTSKKPQKAKKPTASKRNKSIGPSLKGLLPAGTVIKSFMRDRTLEARIDSEGKVLFNGKIFNSPSVAAMSVTVHASNGWHFWKYQDQNGKWVKLDNLRKKD
ncbi:MAG: GIY-YIG nuclease family protein [Ignavibacteria bacterium]|nr:GIY-YIG nuclease family protein [Ignavibacteria bacterium]